MTWLFDIRIIWQAAYCKSPLPPPHTHPFRASTPIHDITTLSVHYHILRTFYSWTWINIIEEQHVKKEIGRVSTVAAVQLQQKKKTASAWLLERLQGEQWLPNIEHSYLQYPLQRNKYMYTLHSIIIYMYNGKTNTSKMYLAKSKCTTTFNWSHVRARFSSCSKSACIQSHTVRNYTSVL